MSDGGKDGGRRGRDRDGESVSVPQDYFLLKIIPCPPVGTHTQTPSTAFSPLTEDLNKGDKSFCSELASGKSGLEKRGSVQGSRVIGEEGSE